MNIPQTSVSQTPGASVAGQLGDLSPSAVDTGLAEVALDAGLAVVSGTADPQVKLPTQGSDVTGALAGFTLYQGVKEPTGTANRYAIGDGVPVLRRGRIWVQVAGADVTKDQTPYIYHTGANAGKIRGTTDANATAAPAGVKVKVGGAAGGLALVEVNLP